MWEFDIQQQVISVNLPSCSVYKSHVVFHDMRYCRWSWLKMLLRVLCFLFSVYGRVGSDSHVVKNMYRCFKRLHGKLN